MSQVVGEERSPKKNTKPTILNKKGNLPLRVNSVSNITPTVNGQNQSIGGPESYINEINEFD